MASRKIMVIFYQNAMPQASNVIGKFLSLAFSPTNDAQKIQFRKIPLETDGGMWHTIFVLPLKGEITDYPRGSDGEQP